MHSIDLGKVEALRLEQILNIDCWLETLRPQSGIYLAALTAGLSNLSLRIDCADCSSPGLQVRSVGSAGCLVFAVGCANERRARPLCTGSFSGAPRPIAGTRE